MNSDQTTERKNIIDLNKILPEFLGKTLEEKLKNYLRVTNNGIEVYEIINEQLELDRKEKLLSDLDKAIINKDIRKNTESNIKIITPVENIDIDDYFKEVPDCIELSLAQKLDSTLDKILQIDFKKPSTVETSSLFTNLKDEIENIKQLN